MCVCVHLFDIQLFKQPLVIIVAAVFENEEEEDGEEVFRTAR